MNSSPIKKKFKFTKPSKSFETNTLKIQSTGKKSKSDNSKPRKSSKEFVQSKIPKVKKPVKEKSEKPSKATKSNRTKTTEQIVEKTLENLQKPRQSRKKSSRKSIDAYNRTDSTSVCPSLDPFVNDIE